MRRDATFNERVLWKLLRNRRLEGVKFRRQVPVGPYIVDFICFEQRLIVEADGPMHDAEHDSARDAWLRGQRFRVLRFPNAQITLHPDLVLDEIRAAAGIEPYPSSGASRHLLPQGEKDDGAPPPPQNPFLARPAP
jgi:very-short-patch-repair endonuclease